MLNVYKLKYCARLLNDVYRDCTNTNMFVPLHEKEQATDTYDTMVTQSSA